MKFFAAIASVFFVLALNPVQAQDTLPAFSVINRNGKVILSWVNNFPVVKQMSIQRSFDSTKGFKTILTLPDPTSVTNGFLDNNAPDAILFYKLYILLDSGKYVFSKSKRPEKKSMQEVVSRPAVTAANATTTTKNDSKPAAVNNPGNNTVTAPAQPVNVGPAVLNKPNDSAAKTGVSVKNEPLSTITTNPTPADEAPGKKYAVESAPLSTKKKSDGLKPDSSTLSARPEVVKPSSYIFTNADGNVTMVLPIEKTHEYSIKFFEDRGDMVFQISRIKEHIVILDKSNFMHSGWFRFELYENGILKEKNKIQIPKDPGMR